MKKAVIVSKNVNNTKTLQTMLREEGYNRVALAETSDDIYTLMEKEDFDLIVINAPLENETGLELACHCGKNTVASIVVIVGESKSLEVMNMLTTKGIMVISKPINKHLFHHYLLFSDCFSRRIRSVIKENTELKTQVEIIKLVDRAKLLLMQNLRMTESQAHRYLEKQAMDLRKSKYDIALRVLKTYEN